MCPNWCFRQASPQTRCLHHRPQRRGGHGSATPECYGSGVLGSRKVRPLVGGWMGGCLRFVRTRLLYTVVLHTLSTVCLRVITCSGDCIGGCGCFSGGGCIDELFTGNDSSKYKCAFFFNIVRLIFLAPTWVAHPRLLYTPWALRRLHIIITFGLRRPTGICTFLQHPAKQSTSPCALLELPSGCRSPAV